MNVLTDINGIIIETASGALNPNHENWYEHYSISTDKKAMELLGQPITDYPGATLQNQNPDSTFQIDVLAQPKAERTNEINKACRSEIISGFESSALDGVTPYHYPFDPEDQSNLMSTFLLAKELNVSKVFKCWDSAGVADYRLHTVAQLTQVGQDAEAHKMAALMKAATLKAQIAAATTAAEVEAIVW